MPHKAEHLLEDFFFLALSSSGVTRLEVTLGINYNYYRGEHHFLMQAILGQGNVYKHHIIFMQNEKSLASHGCLESHCFNFTILKRRWSVKKNWL